MIPKRLKRPKMGLREPDKIVCHSDARWVRGHECCIAGRLNALQTKDAPHTCIGRIEAHHVTTRGAGGGDETLAPLCTDAHKRVHDMGRESFAKAYRVDLESIAAKLWDISPHGKKYRLQHTEDQGP